MDGSQPHRMTRDDLDRELAEALHISPSAELRARIRARVSTEDMEARWRAQAPRAVYSALAVLVIAVAIWLKSGFELAPPMQPPAGVLPQEARIIPDPVRDAALPAGRSGATVSVAPPQGVLARGAARARDARSPSASEEETARPSDREPEVLLSDSERAGVRLLFESAASGRLRLPEAMLQDPTPPIVEARTSVPLLDDRSGDERWKE